MRQRSLASLLLAAFLPLASSTASAQQRLDPSPGRSFPVQQRLRAADMMIEPISDVPTCAFVWGGLAEAPLRLGPVAALALAKAGAYESAYDEYRRILRESPDALVVPYSFGERTEASAVAFRNVFHLRMGRMPPSLLRKYRDEIESDAKALWDQGAAEQQSEPLATLVRDLFSARHADAALDRLGDLAFQAGRFEEAQMWWRRLAAPVGERPSPWQYPDPQVDAALIRAKQILAVLFEGKIAAAEAQLVRFRKEHPNAEGTLAGTKGALHAILEAQLRVRERWLTQDLARPWPAFAGNGQRNRVLATPPSPSLWRDGPTWRTKLPASQELLPIGTPRRPSSHPCIAHDLVYVHGGSYLAAYDLLTGKERFRHSEKEDADNEPAPSDRIPGSSRASAAVAEDRLVAVLRPRSRKTKDDEAAPSNVMIALEATGPNAGKTSWKTEARTPQGQPATFDDPPLVVGRRIYAIMRRSHGGRTKSWMTCVDLEGRSRWIHELEEANELEHDFGRPPLVWAGDRVVHLSNAGWAIAVDARTGERVWSLRYGDGLRHRNGKAGAEGAMLWAEGKLVLAPSDAGGLIGVDAMDGRIVWTLPTADVADLVGATHGRVVFVTRTGMESVDLATGGGRLHWRQPAEGKLPTLGRGLVAGGWIFWPTQDPQVPWRTLTQDEGLPQAPLADAPLREPNYFDLAALLRVPAGETAFGQGCMAVATADELVVFVPNRRLAPKLLQDAHDGRPESVYRLASALRDDGRAEDAKIAFDRLAANASPDDRNLWNQLWSARSAPAPSIPRTLGAWRPFLVRRAEAPKLDGFPLEKAWSRPESGSILPTVRSAAEAHLLVRRGDRLVALQFEAGAVEWDRPLGFAAEWVGESGGRTVVAGSEGIEAFREADGHPLWKFANPHSPGWTLRDGRPARLEPIDPLQGFAFVDDRVAFLIGDQAIVHLQAGDGVPLWIEAPPGSELRPLDRRRIANAAGTGFRPEALTLAANAVGDSSRSPYRAAAFGSTRIAIGLPQGEVEFRDSAGAVRWQYRPDSPHSLSGETAAVFSRESTLLASVRRNFGEAWVRLDLETGKPLWTVEATAFRVPPDPATITLDGRRWYLCTETAVEARSVDDGRLAWRYPLPKGFRGWRTTVARHVLLVHPSEQGSGPTPAEAPLLLFDAAEGMLMQRLAIPYAGGPIAVDVGARGLAATTGGMLHAYRLRDPATRPGTTPP